ncbi:hypothetical protein KUTeg_011595 [Tegillarca granosa]|uniref:Alpha/beta hydrolase fold-3 domain-containing protein n=1 Tax=Tegillarca granosa TaxID=220873 RepID=A0ABQ9F0R7_TEGGR|nr:hypothetical protein KUTeg_011595 [Tegillarca granosa]
MVFLGDSAGGNLAAAVSLKLGKDGDPRFKLTSQTLIYPALQALDLDLPAYRTYNDDGGPFFMAKPLMMKFWLWYGEGNLNYLSEFAENKQLIPDIKQYINRTLLPKKYLSKQDQSPSLTKGNKQLFDKVAKWLLDPYFAPLMASDEELKNLPPTHVITAEYDPLRDDGFLFASRLKALNKTVVHSHYDGRSVIRVPISASVSKSVGRVATDNINFYMLA